MKRLAAVFLASLLTACSAASLVDSFIPLSDASRAMTVKAGDTFRLVLDSNPTTGYRWQLARPVDAAFLQELGSDFQAPKAGGGAGAGGREIWSFKALKAGQAEIVMKYVRPWESVDVPPADQKTFRVSIR